MKTKQEIKKRYEGNILLYRGYEKRINNSKKPRNVHRRLRQECESAALSFGWVLGIPHYETLQRLGEAKE